MRLRRLAYRTAMQAMVVSFPGSAVRPRDDEYSEAGADLAAEFEQRLTSSAPLAYRIALGVLHNTADAEDVAQEAFLRAYRNFPRLRDRERFRAWLARISWRLAIDRQRATRRRERVERAALEQASIGAGGEQVAAWSEFQRRLERAMDELPEKLRQALVLFAIEGHNLSEVALLLGLPEGTVKSRVHLARKQLAEKLKCAANTIQKV